MTWLKSHWRWSALNLFAVLALVTVWAEAELAEFFVLAGLLVLLTRGWDGWKRGLIAGLAGGAVLLLIWVIETWLVHLAPGGENVLLRMLTFFTKAGAFVFGSGLAIVPFLHQGVVEQFAWLNEQQFLDAVAVAMITPSSRSSTQRWRRRPHGCTSATVTAP